MEIWRGCPQSVCTWEMMKCCSNDWRRYVERAVAAGVDAKLNVWMGMPHWFVKGVGNLYAANQTVRATGTFLNDLLERAR
jgi:acetyl esterase/lipase